MKLLVILLQSINILWFGHSYGQDCTEYLPELAVRDGVQNLMVGRFVKANCSLEEHYNFYLQGATEYYSECSYGKTKFVEAEKSVKEVVQGTKWDYVVFQNSLENEGRYETYSMKYVSYAKK